MSATNRCHVLVTNLPNYCDGSLGNSASVEISNDVCTDYPTLTTTNVPRKLATSTRTDNGGAMRRGAERIALLHQLIGCERVCAKDNGTDALKLYICTL